MGKVIDRVLLLLYSITVLAASVTLMAYGFHWIHADKTLDFISTVYEDTNSRIVLATGAVLLLLVSLRFLYISVRRNYTSVPSIDQRTDFGDIRISLETVENLSLKSAARIKGVKDLKARVNVSDAGLEITIRAIVDGENSIPLLTEEVQRQVKGHVEEITGVPVAFVSVYVANIIQSHTFKSRVD
ncbi:MAG TPA: alkaline shock response membrane anchor protein AmaP [Bacilli bacterium]